MLHVQNLDSKKPSANIFVRLAWLSLQHNQIELKCTREKHENKQQQHKKFLIIFDEIIKSAQ